MKRLLSGALAILLALTTLAGTAGAASPTPDDDRWMRGYYNTHGNVAWERDSSGFLPSSMIVGSYHVLFLKSGLVFRIEGSTGVAYVSGNLTDPPSAWRLATLAEVVAAAHDNEPVVHALAWDHPAIATLAFAPCVAQYFYADLQASAFTTGMYFSNSQYAPSIRWLYAQGGLKLCIYALDLLNVGRSWGWLADPSTIGGPL